MSLVSNPTSENFLNFQKCGEITTAKAVGRKIFSLNCIFCTTVCLQLEEFTLHIEKNHHNIVYAVDTNDEEISYEEHLDDTMSEQPKCKRRTSIFEEKKILKKKNDKWPEFDDPLLEAPMSINTVDPSLCVDQVNIAGRCKQSGYEQSDEEMDELYDDPTEVDANSSIAESNYEDDLNSVGDAEDSNEDLADFNADNIENKNLLLALIEGFEKYNVLWSTNFSNSKNRKKKRNALEMISQFISTKLNLTLNSDVISERLKNIRAQYCSEIQKQKHAETLGEFYDKPWYFDKLVFLNRSLNNKKRNKRGAKALSNEKPALPLPYLSEAQTIALIEIYKSFPCLWDMQHIGFRFKAQRNEALDGMIEAIKNKLKLNFTQDELQKKLYRIRYACTQEKHRKLQSERMQEEFKPSSSYFFHIEFLIENVGPFKCDFCEEIFNGADQYRIHKSKHDGSMPFVCPICSRGFMKVGNCTVHVRRHTRDYPFECPECRKRFATTTDVNVHMRYHTGEKPYFCDVCGQSFRTWSFFDTHMRRHQKRPSHKCTICSKAFYENNKLTEHMKAHLNVRDKVCRICDKAFTSSKYLRQHEQIHAEKKRYTCKICEKGFAQYAGLSGHMKSHGTTVNGNTIIEENKQKKIKNEIGDKFNN